MTKRKTTEEFIEEVEEKFPGKWLLDKVDYKDHATKVSIGCKKHGYFKITPNNILRGQGCRKCYDERRKYCKLKTNEQFIKEVEEKFPNKWLLDKVDYKGGNSRILVGCKKHGYWEIKATDLLNNRGCPICKESRGERLIASILDSLEVKYIRQKRFKDCIYKRQLPFDFYIPSIKTLIEYDGRQHFVPIKRWGGKAALELIIKKDWIKSKYAQQNGYRLVRFCYDDDKEEIKNRLSWIVDRFTDK